MIKITSRMISVFLLGQLCSQEALSNDVNLFEMSLEDLLDVKVITATRQEDQSHRAPIAISSISSIQLAQSAVTNIAEALRLLPGVLVKEKANGLYDISIRGFSGMPPGNGPAFSSDSSTLVMVDEQSVYNHFTGGVFWPSLGIAIQDIDRIEVVRGPASALFGPNAANGVIHIITKTAQKHGWSGQATMEQSDNTRSTVSLRSQYLNDKLEATIYGNVDSRDREIQDYYSFERESYVPSEGIFVLGTNLPLDFVTPNAYPKEALAYETIAAGASIKTNNNKFGTSSLKVDYHDSDFHANTLTGGDMAFSTPDLCDEYPDQVRVLDPTFKSFGGVKQFSGEVVTIKCFEDNSLVKEQANTEGKSRILVVDGGGSMRRALLGDMIAEAAVKNNWSGLIIYGCVRDVDALAELPLGVHALAAHPVKTEKRGLGDLDIPVTFAGQTIKPGEFIYADNNGILVSQQALKY